MNIFTQKKILVFFWRPSEVRIREQEIFTVVSKKIAIERKIAIYDYI